MVAPKDQTEKMDKIRVIYHIKCDNCEMDYIRETERRARDTFLEHRRKCMIEKSPMAHHVHYNNHSINHQNHEIVDRDWHRRGIKETIYIRVRIPTLNRNQRQPSPDQHLEQSLGR